MRVLVAVASKHEATAEIAERIGDVIRELLHEEDPGSVVDVRPVGTVAELEEYDAVLVGSAIYLGRWLKPARHFVHAHAKTLTHRPVWLFASGPVGDPLLPEQESGDGPELVALTGAREYRIFAGRLRPADLEAVERSAVHAVHAAEGDFRDWSEITGWAGRIADDLLGSRAAAP